MPISRAIAIACLRVLGWLLFVLTALFLVYVAMAWRYGDPSFKLAYLALFAAGSFAGAFACRHLASRIEGWG